jgi:hypothetical protein
MGFTSDILYAAFATLKHIEIGFSIVVDTTKIVSAVTLTLLKFYT